MHSERDDRELLEAWRGGEAAAGNTLLARHFAALYRLFHDRTDDVGELVQRTMLACVEARDRFPPEASFRAFLFGIARNQLLMAQRKAGRGVRALRRSAVTDRVVASPSAVVAANEEQRLVRDAMRELPLDLRLTLQLHYWEEFSTAEIGEALGIPAGTVKSRLWRARGLLREQIAALAPNPAVREVTLSQLDRLAHSLRELSTPS